jgi:hypothetical protein
MRRRITMRTLGVALTLFGGAAFGAGFLIAFGVDFQIPASFELPLGDLRGVAVDSQGNIYVGTLFYCRVQAYDANGRYRYGRFLRTAGGALRMRVNSDDRLEVATARTDLLYTFAGDGRLISVLSDSHSFDDFGSTSEGKWRGEHDGTVYMARHTFTCPTLIKRTPDGQETVVIRTPLHKWVFMGPFPAFLWLVVGACIRGIANRRRRNSRDTILNPGAD